MSPAAATAELADAWPLRGLPAPVDDPLEIARFTRWEAPGAAGAGGADGSRIGVSSLQLSGMYCAACAPTIESALGAVPGVIEASVSAASQRASVRWDAAITQPSRLIAAVQGAGYGAVPDAAASARELRRQEHRAAVWRLFVASFCAMQVMMLATPSYVASAGDLPPDLRQLLNWASWLLSLPVLWFAGMPFLHGAWQAVRRRRIGMDVPVALGILVTFVASTAATFDPAGALGHETYFDSLTMFIAFLWLGRYLELRARHRAAEVLETTLCGLPPSAWRVAADGAVEEVSVQRLARGDRVRVPSGAAVPADGSLLTPAASVGEALITGESQACTRRAGDALLAGSLNLGAPLEMRVERVGADTRYEAIVALMREALSQRPAVARVADRWAGPFLWAVLLLAAGAAAAWSVIDPSRAVWVAVSVLIVTCPCALSLATPATLVAAAAGLARRGVLLRRLDALETLAQVRHIFIDKTGTLTEDRAHLEAVLLDEGAAAGLTADAALQIAASLARWSSHPASVALVAAGGAGSPARSWKDVDELPGAGLRATDPQGAVWQLGSAAWVGAPAALHDASVWLACNGQVQAAFRFAEALRADAAQTIAALRRDGVRVSLLSGDSTARAEALALQLGIDDVTGSASPECKLQILRTAQAGVGPVAMVGDGINDAPVLAAADISIAMGHGALAAQHSADAVILSGRLNGITEARAAAQRAMAIVKQNLVWAAAYNAACIPLAMAGWLPPWAAGLGMASSSLFVVLNAQRAATRRP